MAKVLASVAKVAGAIALTAAAFATLNPGLAIAGVKLATIAAVAGLTSTAPAAGSILLSRPPVITPGAPP